jgi:hypothetical protein
MGAYGMTETRRMREAIEMEITKTKDSGTPVALFDNKRDLRINPGEPCPPSARNSF